MQDAEGAGDRAVPRREVRFHDARQLLHRGLRQRRAGRCLDEGVVAGEKATPFGRRGRGAPGPTRLAPFGVPDVLELAGVEAEHERGEGLDEAAVGAEGEAGVAELGRERFDGPVVQPDVEHGFGEARDRRARAGPNGEQERPRRAVELPARDAFQPFHGARQIGLQRLRQVVWMARGLAPGGRGNGEAGRHRQVERGEEREVRAFQAERFHRVGGALRSSAPERVDPLRHRAARRSPSALSSETRTERLGNFRAAANCCDAKKPRQSLGSGQDAASMAAANSAAGIAPS